MIRGSEDKARSEMPDESRVISFLKSHSADTILHVNCNLLTHLMGTFELLRSWGAASHVCRAGLCHAVYGTSGFNVALLDISSRSDLAAVIGDQAEELVYFYASCDRLYVYPQIGYKSKIKFRDRFTATVFEPDDTLFKSFLELTFANELEGARRIPDFVASTSATLVPFFRRCERLVSGQAFAHFMNVYQEGGTALSRDSD